MVFFNPKQVTTDSLNQFIPKGFHIVTEYSADINADKLQDKIVLLADTSESIRPLLILIRQQDKSLKQVARNDKIIDEQFQSITSESGAFTVEYFYHGGGEHCKKTIIFKYSKKDNDWFLDKQEMYCTSDTPTNSGGYDSTTTTTKTTKDFGKISFKNYNGTE